MIVAGRYRYRYRDPYLRLTLVDRQSVDRDAEAIDGSSSAYLTFEAEDRRLVNVYYRKISFLRLELVKTESSTSFFFSRFTFVAGLSVPGFDTSVK